MRARRKGERQELRRQWQFLCLKLINILLVWSAFMECWMMYYKHATQVSGWQSHLMVSILFCCVYHFALKVYDGFSIAYSRMGEQIYSQILSVLVTDGGMYLVICLLAGRFLNLWPGIAAICGQLIAILLWVVTVDKWYRKATSPKRSMIVYNTWDGISNLIEEAGIEKTFEVREILSLKELMKDPDCLEGYEAVFLYGIEAEDRNRILSYCVDHRIEVFTVPGIGDLIMSGAEKVHLFHLPMVQISRYNPSIVYLFMKRTIDIFVSLLGLIVTSPILLAAALAVKSDGGPVFYSQKRLTKDGKGFYVLKFRSMRIDAEKDGIARLSTGDKDNRVTPVGQVLRKLRIDELPQLINILKGDMTLVGPRPERPEIASEYEKEFPEFRLRLQAKAGLTGYAQVYGKYNTTPHDKLAMDLMYIAKPSLMEDFRIMLATVKPLFVPESTEGIAENQTTAMVQSIKIKN